MPKTLDQHYELSQGETEWVSIDFTEHLDSGETLAGVPTVAQVDPTTGLTIDNEELNAATYVDAHRAVTVAIAHAARFTVAIPADADVGVYTLRVTVDSSAATARTFVRDFKVTVV